MEQKTSRSDDGQHNGVIGGEGQVKSAHDAGSGSVGHPNNKDRTVVSCP